MEQTIAVLGTGIMGGPIARNLSRAGFAVRAWNRTREKAEPLTADGVIVVDSPADAVRDAAFVLTMLIDGDAVEQTITGAMPAVRPDAVWLQCSTVGIEATARLADLAKTAGVAFVDAPVVGTKKPAEEGKLTVLASGPRELEERCRPVFAAIGQRTEWLDEVGAGTRLKLVVNSWVLALTAAVAEAIALAEGLGLDPALFLSTIAGSPSDSAYAQLKGHAMIERDFAPSFPAAGAAKDSALIRDAALSADITADVIAAVREKFERTVTAGHGDDDMAAAYLVTARS